MRDVVRLALPFAAAALFFLAGGIANEFEALALRDALGWASIVTLGVGVVLVALYGLTRFVAWAARR